MRCQYFYSAVTAKSKLDYFAILAAKPILLDLRLTVAYVLHIFLMNYHMIVHHFQLGVGGRAEEDWAYQQDKVQKKNLHRL